MSSTFTIRPARMDEVEAASEVLNEHSRRLHGVDEGPAAELLQYWESPDVDLGSDVLVAEDVDGSLVGYADVGAHGEHVWLDVRSIEPEVLPELIEAIEERARQKKPGAHTIGYTAEADEPLRAAYERAGYEFVRASFRMEISLADPPPEPVWPDGVTVRMMNPGEEEWVYEAQMASFADTWMFVREPFEIWEHWMVKGPSFDPSLWFLAEAGDELVGISLSRLSESEPGLGWVRVLGVIPEHRQRGLGQALLRHTFAVFAQRGCDRVGLGVDAENPTGAVRVYERAGMHVARKNLLLEKSQG